MTFLKICVILVGLYFRHSANCVKIINILGMEQEDSFGINKLPAIFLGVEKVNSIYNDTFQLNLIRTTFGERCSPNDKAVAFAEIYYKHHISVSFGPGKSHFLTALGRYFYKWTISPRGIIGIVVRTSVKFITIFLKLSVYQF